MDELKHYGVLGMKWGVHRAIKKSNNIGSLTKKAAKYDKKSASLAKKSEKLHNENDLGKSNKASVQAQVFSKKAAKFNQKAAKTKNEFKRSMLEKKAAKYDYKSAQQTLKGNRIAKTTGYGAEAMKYSIKSDIIAEKAARVRLKRAKNKSYIAKMNRKLSNSSNLTAKGELIAQRFYSNVKL